MKNSICLDTHDYKPQDCFFIFYYFIIFNYEILKWLVFLWFMLRYGIKK